MVGHEQADRRLNWVWMVVLAAMLTSPLYAYDGSRRDRSRRERPRRDMVREVEPKLSEEGQAGFREVEATLKDLLTAVNHNQQPDQALLDKAAGLLSDNKRYSQDYADNQKAVFMLLQAWVSYCEKDMTTAMNWGLRAAKTDETDGDAWISSAVFCLLNDKRPRLPRVLKTPSVRRSRGNGDFDRMSSMDRPDQNTEMRSGTLEFELTALRQEMFSERYEQIDYQKQWGDQIDYDPAKDTLCVLFWQSDVEAGAEEEIDPNDLSPDQQRAAKLREMQEPTMSERGVHSPKLELKTQQTYFKRIAKACKDEKSLKFIEINADLPKIAEKVQEQRLIDMVDEEGMPLLYAAETDLTPADYAPITRPGPVMVVTAPGGKIKYAGPAADFVPAFILTATTGVEIDLAAIARPQTHGMRGMEDGLDRDPLFMDPFMQMEMGMPRPRDPRDMKPKAVDPNMPPAGADPNMPAAVDPNMPAVKQAAPAAAPKAPKPAVQKELTLEDQMRADNLLREAKLQIDACRKLYSRRKAEKGVEACRKLLEKYPGTEYADKAKEQLKRIPQRPGLWEDLKIHELLDL